MAPIALPRRRPMPPAIPAWRLSALAVTVDTAPPVRPTITSFSPDTGVVGDGITDPAILTLTGTAVANSTVNVYDGATLLGTATANGSGAWSYTTAPLPDGVHSFTATDTVCWQYQCCVSGHERDGRYGGAGGAELPRSRPTAARWATHHQ